MKDLEELTKEKQLSPVKHPQKELFLCDIGDAVIKDDVATMEHPIFSLSKKPVLEVKKYQNGDTELEVVPSIKGMATIYDKDILIFATSQLIKAQQEGAIVSRHIEFDAYDFLVFSNRATGGYNYELLRDALARLDGTRLRTTIITGGTEQTTGFGIIDGFHACKKMSDGRVIKWNVVLSEWLFNAITHNEVLTLHPDYFRLRKPLERRVYEIARKHCGRKQSWCINIDLLQKKCGSNSPRKKFRHMLKIICAAQHLPDYKVTIVDENVTFESKKDFILSASSESYQNSAIPKLSTKVIEQFKKEFPYIDSDFVEGEWRKWAVDKELPKNPEGSFLNFGRKYMNKQ